MLLGLGLIFLLIVVALAIKPKKVASQQSIQTTFFEPAPAVRQRSMRELQLDEDSAILADVYRRRAQAKYEAKVVEDAAALLTDEVSA